MLHMIMNTGFTVLLTQVCLSGSEPPAVACEGTFPHHLQGICVDQQALYWSFTTRLVKTDRSGKLLKQIPVANHHGDLCYYDGKLFVAVNLGRFNDPQGNADSWVYVYRAQDLVLIKRHPTQEVFHGAGGIGFYNDHFYVVGGLPDDIDENYVYQYTRNFEFRRKHTIKSGHTNLGIQTATFSHNRWWFGCYGNPQILLVTDPEFKHVERYLFNCSLGITGQPAGPMLAASGICNDSVGCTGKARPVTTDPKTGLRYLTETHDPLQ